MSRMYERPSRTSYADTGGTKQSPIVMAVASIKLWILEPRVIFMIFSLLRDGFRDWGALQI
jgi:hypothetical protein